ncbi:MAG: class I SAM-dependent methyltransferase [Nitrospira sp.]|nr:class I SAM-dependent methyltransferase [Nitrospira sp.]MDH4242219.1 class I SAM-dependent methyltransferase [Nitrospira sp.]MDH4356278.1 class I SAM-dependent methyltransferase [Nitrospira sp.]MDH5317615.1 class I SAM-dependent methyltransferase [Nitrospira sp.]
MEKKKAELLEGVAQYYSAKLVEHGETPRGVDWNSEESQVLRFSQLTKLIDSVTRFSVNDLGCGYGALYEYLASRFQEFDYRGYDVSADMVRVAAQRYAAKRNAQFLTAAEPDGIADYGIASGLFNVRLGHGDAEWRGHVESTLNVLDRTSLKGFAFNCLTSYSDADKRKDYLYYADPCHVFDLCKRRYSRHVTLLHDYGLYEFAVLVRKVL